MANDFIQFKIVIVGDGNVGKTTYVKQLLTSTFESMYVPTLGVEVHPVHFNTNYGRIIFNIWDCAGVKKYGGLRDGYYILANGCIAMYDGTNQSSKDSIGKWVGDVKRVFNNNPTPYNLNKLEGKFPVVVCGTKNEFGCNNEHISISSKTKKNLYKPMLTLARELMDKPGLIFLD